MKPFNKIINISPDDTSPKSLAISNYLDNEYLKIKIQGMEPFETGYFVMSQTLTGDRIAGTIEEILAGGFALKEGFYNQTVEADDSGDAIIKVPPTSVKYVAESGTVHLSYWTAPNYEPWCRAKGSMVRGPVAGFDLRLIPNPPELVLEPIEDVSVEASPGDHLSIVVTASGGLPPINFMTTVGFFTGRVLRIPLTDPRPTGNVTVTAVDARGVPAPQTFSLTITNPATGIGSGAIGSTFEVA